MKTMVTSASPLLFVDWWLASHDDLGHPGPPLAHGELLAGPGPGYRQGRPPRVRHWLRLPRILRYRRPRRGSPDQPQRPHRPPKAIHPRSAISGINVFNIPDLISNRCLVADATSRRHHRTLESPSTTSPDSIRLGVPHATPPTRRSRRWVEGGKGSRLGVAVRIRATIDGSGAWVLGSLVGTRSTRSWTAARERAV